MPNQDRRHYIHLDSALRTSGTHSHPRWKLKREITINDILETTNNKLRLRMVQFSLPYGFYNMNERNNKLKIHFIDSDFDAIYVLPTGNYNVFQLMSEITKDAPAFTLTYDRIKNKITLRSELNFRIDFDNECFNQQLGFSLGSHVSVFNPTDNLYEVTSDQVVNSNPINAVYVRSLNLVQSNSQENERDYSSIIARIPVDVNPGGIISFEPTVLYEVHLDVNIINEIDIQLTTKNIDEEINTNGLDFQISLEIDIVLGDENKPFGITDEDSNDSDDDKKKKKLIKQQEKNVAKRL